jgi:hypothetical protein
MDPLARYALYGCIAASGLGGVVLSIVTVKYGLVPPSEDDPIEVTHRRLFVTHLSHAFAAMAFAAVALLAAAVVLREGGLRQDQGAHVQAIAEEVRGVEQLTHDMSRKLEQLMDRLEQRDAARPVK